MTEPAPGPPPRRKPLKLWRSSAEIRKERFKLVANALNALGVAFIAGTLIAPLLDPVRAFNPLDAVIGLACGLLFCVAASVAIGYMEEPKE